MPYLITYLVHNNGMEILPVRGGGLGLLRDALCSFLLMLFSGKVWYCCALFFVAGES